MEIFSQQKVIRKFGRRTFFRPQRRGVHPPEAMMHFPPVSDFPPIFDKFLDWKISKMLPFPEKIFDFHPPKCLMSDDLFLVIDHKFRIPPIFPVLEFPSVSRKLLFPPTF